MNTLEFQYHDGGRADAGYRGETRDCVARAIPLSSMPVTSPLARWW